MKFIHFTLVIISFFTLSCGESVDDKMSTNNKKEGEVKNFDDQGRLISMITYRHGMKNGKAINYLPENGKVNQVMNYVDNKLNGDFIWYYETGKLYRITHYKMGAIDGIRKYFYKTGLPMAEIPFKDGKQIEGLKEWKNDGSLIAGYPEIIFEPFNNIAKKSQFILRFKLSNKLLNVNFYRIIERADRVFEVEIDTDKGTGELKIPIPFGVARKEKIEIKAVFTTEMGNSFITTKSFNLNVANM